MSEGRGPAAPVGEMTKGHPGSPHSPWTAVCDAAWRPIGELRHPGDALFRTCPLDRSRKRHGHCHGQIFFWLTATLSRLILRIYKFSRSDPGRVKTLRSFGACPSIACPRLMGLPASGSLGLGPRRSTNALGCMQLWLSVPSGQPPPARLTPQSSSALDYSYGLRPVLTRSVQSV